MAARRGGDESSRDELSRLLLALRGDRGQTEVAALAGLTQAKVSRAERGRYPMSPEEAERYARALGADDRLAQQVRELATAKVAAHVRGRASLVRVAAAIQERIDRLEDDAAEIRGWQPLGLNGALQTTAFTAALLSGDGGGDPGPAWWTAWRRRATKLPAPGRTWYLLVSEAVLRWPLVSRPLMADQLAHLIELSHLPTLRLGVLDLTTPKPLLPPPGFHLYDAHTATVATDVGTSFVTDTSDVAHFIDLHERLAEVALYDDDARTLLGRIATDHRNN